MTLFEYYIEHKNVTLITFSVTLIFLVQLNAIIKQIIMFN